LARLTAHTLSETGALRAVIERVRKEDYCLSSEEHELGVHALAVPLRDSQGRTVAALNVVAETTRLSAEELKRDLLPLLWETAAVVRPLL
jgi:IclR family pca regulon transcriptional regulator